MKNILKTNWERYKNSAEGKDAIAQFNRLTMLECTAEEMYAVIKRFNPLFAKNSTPKENTGIVESIASYDKVVKDTLPDNVEEWKNIDYKNYFEWLTCCLEDLSRERIRKEGSRRKPLTEKYPRIKEHILAIVDPKTYGNPERVLSYTTLSVRTIRDLLDKVYGERISFRSVCSLLEEMEYSRQGNAKLLQVGTSHPDRKEQFEYINNKVMAFLEEGQPVISIDTKKKEILGNFHNAGKEFRQAKNPHLVYDHDWMIKELGKIAPYGVYNLNNNTGFVNLGISHDTAEFAVESVMVAYSRTIHISERRQTAHYLIFKFYIRFLKMIYLKLKKKQFMEFVIYLL